MSSTTISPGSLLMQSWIAKSISNLDSSRVRNSNLETRTQGWTEAWLDTVSPTSDPSSSKQNYEPQLVTLVQFRPAWFEQLLLHMSGIPFQLQNSPYAATEATGPLPFLRDRNSLVGCRHPGANHGNYKNDIELYLQERPDWNIASSEMLPQHQNQLHLIRTILITQVQPALEVLRFNDADAWEQVYRPQYIAAAASSRRFFLPPVAAWLQAWGVRVVAQQSQLPYNWSLEGAKAILIESYSTLEQHVPSSSNAWKHPTWALLGAHLLDALQSVYAVTILSDYPKLVQFVQHLYNTYLDGTINSNKKELHNLHMENAKINASNAFCQPIRLTNNSIDTFSHALQVMQSLSPNFQTVLEETRFRRHQEEQLLVPKRKEDFMYTWRMGGTPATADDDNSNGDDTTSSTKWRQDHKINDEVWISCVIGVTALAFTFGTRNQT